MFGFAFEILFDSVKCSLFVKLLIEDLSFYGVFLEFLESGTDLFMLFDDSLFFNGIPEYKEKGIHFLFECCKAERLEVNVSDPDLSFA